MSNFAPTPAQLDRFMKSVLFMTDSYKVGMWRQYPPGTAYVESAIEARGEYDSMFIGLQGTALAYLTEPVTLEDVEFAREFYTAHGDDFNYDGWRYVVNHCGGILPLKISAVKEGTIVPSKNVLTKIINTDPIVPWATTWVEGTILRGVWYPTEVASTSKRIKDIIKAYLGKSGDLGGLEYMLHDFGYRGAHVNESSMIGDFGHIANFRGSDTSVGALYAMRYYGAAMKDTSVSINASEHSTITSWGRENEIDAFANMIKKFSKPGAVFACVSDSYHIYNACKMWGGPILKPLLESTGGKLIIRPDSGDPIEVLPKMMQILGDLFGFTTNDKGYKVLNTVGIIWGDGINEHSILSILTHMVDYLGWSANNFAFGMGGALLGAPQRDDNSWAMKCTSVWIDSDGTLVQRDVFKDPITASSKKSKKGSLELLYNGKDYVTVNGLDMPPEYDNNDWVSVLETVYENGKLLRFQTLNEIRELSNR